LDAGTDFTNIQGLKKMPNCSRHANITLATYLFFKSYFQHNKYHHHHNHHYHHKSTLTLSTVTSTKALLRVLIKSLERLQLNVPANTFSNNTRKVKTCTCLIKNNGREKYGFIYLFAINLNSQ